MSWKTCFSCFPCFLLFSYLKNERKFFRIFALFAQISRLLTAPVFMISHDLSARQNREKLAAISCVVHANFSKILRMFDRWMRAFAALHAPATRRRNSATSECFRSDAGRSFGALRVDRAENLQRIRAFSSGHFAQWRCRTHGFFGAQHGADFHWSRGRLAIFKSE